MPLMSDDRIRSLAATIRPHITPYIAQQGHVTDDQVKKLCRDYAGCQVVSERTLQMIQTELCEL